MTRTRLAGGKCGPRLVQDLQNYDPFRLQPDAINLLVDIVYRDDQHEENPRLKSPICRHVWGLQVDLSQLPEPPFKSQQNYLLICYCTRCRLHLDISLSFPLPSHQIHDHPFHHFIHQPDESQAYNKVDLGDLANYHAAAEKQHFVCSISACRVRLELLYRMPRLHRDWITQLTDPHVIGQRAEAAMAADPTKYEGHAPPVPGTILENLLLVVDNAMHADDSKKPYPRYGKTWTLNFGPACDSLMLYLGLTSDDSFWYLPRLDQSVVRRRLLSDVKKEILVLMSLRPDDERRSLKAVFVPATASTYLNSLVGAITSEGLQINRSVDLTIDEHPTYLTLGASADFDDEFIYQAYKRQVAVDSSNAPYYLECLHVIANGRSSDHLSIKAALEDSEGSVRLRDLESAYQRLGLQMESASLTDDLVVGSFQARVADAPRQEAELRRGLGLVGLHRKSSRIADVASPTLANHTQALSFLDAAEHTPDEFIVTLYTLKIDNKPEQEIAARKAVALIANYRKSRPLKQWLETGNLGNVEMDVDQAYARLDISDRTISDDIVLATYGFHTEEQPSQAENLNNALTAIAKARNSSTLLSHLGLDSEGLSHEIQSWPIGLDNIGNTCYLNSLLQFYFAVKPFRDMLLQEHYNAKQNVEKRVGSRTVSQAEIDQAVQLAAQLSLLFRNMITLPTASYRPAVEVARLTLLTPKLQTARRQSLGDADLPKADQEMMPLADPAAPMEGLSPPATVEAEPNPLAEPVMASQISSTETLTTDAKPSQALQEAEFGAQQQDVGEINGNVLFQLECALPGESVDSAGEQIDLIKQLFFGKQKTFITNSTGTVRIKEDYFSDIKINVVDGPRDIYSALDEAFDEQQVEVAGTTEPQYSTISEVPPILQIHIQRAQFDLATKKGYKSENHLAFSEVIHMDRYVDSSIPQILQRRQQSWTWKAELRKVEGRLQQLKHQELNMTVPNILRVGREYLDRLQGIDGLATQIPPTLAENLEFLASETETEMKDLKRHAQDLQEKITSQFVDMQSLAYRLAAVFVHRGSTSAGHYWIYIFDTRAGLWRKYNDERVSQVVDHAEIYAASKDPRPPTPYFLVYVRDNIFGDLIDPMCRDVAEQPHERPRSEPYQDIFVEDLAT